MLPILTHTLRSRWLATLAHAGLWLLLYLAVTGLKGRTPIYGDWSSRVGGLQSLFPDKSWDGFFSPKDLSAQLVATNLPSPFFTRHFIKETAPAPPPPTTRKIELTYQGFWQTAEGPQETIVRLGDSFLITPVGSNLTANLFAADATMQALTITNSTGQTNLMPLNLKRELEVPIQ